MDDSIREATDAEQMVRLYERHSNDPHVRAVMAVYAEAHLALERTARALVRLQEHRMAAGIASRAHDIFLQAVRHLDIIVRRAEDEPNSPTPPTPPTNEPAP